MAKSRHVTKHTYFLWCCWLRDAALSAATTPALCVGHMQPTFLLWVSAAPLPPGTGTRAEGLQHTILTEHMRGPWHGPSPWVCQAISTLGGLLHAFSFPASELPAFSDADAAWSKACRVHRSHNHAIFAR